MNRLIASTVAAGLALSYPLPAAAAFETGNDLLRDCTTEQTAAEFYQRDSYCLGFILGAVDAHAMASTRSKERLFCLPTGATAAQAREVVVGYLQRHPEQRHYSAASLVAMAMKEAFPCRGQ